MLEFLMSAPFLIGLAIGAVLGVFAGIGLGRRSNHANAAYDKIRREAAELRDQLADAKAELQGRLNRDE